MKAQMASRTRSISFFGRLSDAKLESDRESESCPKTCGLSWPQQVRQVS